MERARVARVRGQVVWVALPRFPGVEFGPCQVYTDQPIAAGDEVIVGRVSGSSDDLVVLGVLRTA